VIGLGSPHGDDQAGWVAVDRLRPHLPDGAVALKAADALGVLEAMAGKDAAIVVDAGAPNGQPGTVRSFVWRLGACTDVTPWSTHGIGLIDALRLGEALGSLPGRVTVLTIEAATASPGDALSPEANLAIDSLLESILGEL
jgi:hydrogenase maturation protease